MRNDFIGWKRSQQGNHKLELNILQVSRKLIRTRAIRRVVKASIKRVAQRGLKADSYEYVADCYTSVCRGLGKQRDLKQVIRILRQARINRVIAKHSRANKDFFFIQVGACDGKSEDPIYRFVTQFSWRGILVEPVKHLFDKLLVTYQGHNRLFFENVAISRDADVRKLYRINCTTSAGFVRWYERSSSFFEEHLLRQMDQIKNDCPGAEIIEEQVSCRSFNYLLNKYNVKTIDLLHIDTEGYDYEIIKMVPFDRVKPNMIFYESEHLSPPDKLSCEKMLTANGYKLIRAKDTFAYLPRYRNRRKAAA
jgi:FkbM family methyltransferase